jgi:hypothetical protein
VSKGLRLVDSDAADPAALDKLEAKAAFPDARVGDDP